MKMAMMIAENRQLCVLFSPQNQQINSRKFDSTFEATFSLPIITSRAFFQWWKKCNKSRK